MPVRLIGRLLLPLCLLLIAGVANAAGWPDADYDPAIPTLQSVLGHAPGERITTTDQAARYLRALAAAAPDRTRLVEYARSWEGRPLHYLLVGSRTRIAQVDAIKTGMQRLANPRGLTDGEASALINRLPAVVWLAYGVHGNEISSTDAALLTAYHLLASHNDARIERLRRETLVGIDPVQNPDGRARFTHHYQQTFGIEPAAEAIAAERNEPWPRGRTNHYLFDMNRDWLPLTQPEVQGRVATFLEFFPVVHVDLHEMGTDRSYYFPPPAQPFNPHITEQQRANLEVYGRTIAGWFDRFGFEYFTRDVYDAYYPGYGDTWPAFQGGVGMTFEMASARGRVGQRRDGSLVTYDDGVQRHFVASLATVEAAATHREQFLRNFVAYRRSALAGEHGGAREYLIPLTGDDSAVGKLAEKLTAHGIEVRRTSTATRACDVDLPVGSFLVAGRQPAGRMVRTFLEADSPLDADFLAEQERRRSLGKRAQLYDVLGWSLPRLYNVAVVPCDAPVDGGAAPFDGRYVPAFAAPDSATVAWLVPWGTRAAGRFLASGLRDGLVVQGADEAFTLGERDYPRGTLVIRVADNAATPTDVAVLSEWMGELAAATGAEVVATDSSWTSDGPSFGSSDVRTLPAPRIALAWDEPTSSYSAGNTRFVLERQFGYPVVPVRTSDLGRPALDRFDVVILPDGRNYASALGNGGVAALKGWVSRGGVLIGMSGGMRFLTEADVGLLPTAVERLADETSNGGNGSGDDGDVVDGTLLMDVEDFQAAILPSAPKPDPLPGVLLRAEPDPDHWLTAGLSDGVNFMVEGRDVYRPLTLDEGTNALRFAGPEQIAAGGHLWAENRAQWAYKPAVAAASHGRGVVIGFVADPTFRASLDGANVLLLNAVLRAPAHTGRLR
jgi:hypothetical protein